MSQSESSRFDFGNFPWVFSLQLSEAPGREHPLRIEARNISRTGVKFVSNRKIPIFEQVQISLFEKATGKDIALLFGKVIRVEEIDTGFGEKTYGIAVEFLSGNAALDKMIPERESGSPGV